MTTSEQLVADFLLARGFTPERFSKDETREPGQKTPDFRVLRHGEFAFYCEVKETTDADPLDDHSVEVDDGVFVAEQIHINDDSRANRFSAIIRKAAKQFIAVNPDHVYPNVLAIVNVDDLCTVATLNEVLAGFLLKHDGYYIHTAPQASHGRVAKYKRTVDLYIWLDASGDALQHRFLLWDDNDDLTRRIEELFGRGRERRQPPDSAT
jgi:hypothetical protein